MKHSKAIYIPEWDATRLTKVLYHEPKDETEVFSEDQSFSYTAIFDDGREMDIKCCGVQYEEGSDNLPWTEAVLFDHDGVELCHTEPDCDYFGEWILECDGETYSVIVKPEWKKETIPA